VPSTTPNQPPRPRLRAPRLALSLLRRPAALGAALLLALLGALGGLVPLLDVPGYELGLAGAWLGVLLAGPLALAAVRAERARSGPGADAVPAGGPGVAALASALAASALLGLLFAASAVRAAFGPCRALAGAAAFPVLALPSAWLACALATAAAWWARGRAGRTALTLLAAVVGSLATTLWAAWRGPAAFALDHLLGVFPGPLYDERLVVDARLLLFRLSTAALAVAVGAGAAGLAARRVDPRRARRAALLLGLAAAAFTTARVQLRQRVLDGDRDAIARALGGRLEGPACTLIFPAEKPAPLARAALDDCEFHAADVATALGLPTPPRVTVFLHRSDEEKRRHVGASATSFTKPWLREIQLTDAGGPHPVLRHELVHAVAAALEPGWLGVPARRGVWVSMGLVEGLAVALELPRGAWTLHQWARASRDLGFLPDVAAALDPAEFWRAAPARAYGAAGSFLAFLLGRHGAARVAALYRTGDFPASLGEPVGAAVAEWQAFLSTLEVPRGLRNAARARYARPAVFAVPCAREVAELEAHAYAQAGAGGPELQRACQDLRRVASLTGRAGPLRAVGDLLARSGDLDAASAAYHEALLAAPEADGLFRALLGSAESDLAWRRDEPAAAAVGWYQALAVGPDRPEERLLQAKLTALTDVRLATEARPLLLGLEAAPAALARLAPIDHPLAHYLLARQALARLDLADALPRLERAAAGPLPDVLRDEARFLLAEARCGAGQQAAGEAGFAALAASLEAPADRERAAAGVRRCRFDAARAGGARAAGAAAGAGPGAGPVSAPAAAR
jgi:hypothetical protein